MSKSAFYLFFAGMLGLAGAVNADNPETLGTNNAGTNATAYYGPQSNATISSPQDAADAATAPAATTSNAANSSDLAPATTSDNTAGATDNTNTNTSTAKAEQEAAQKAAEDKKKACASAPEGAGLAAACGAVAYDQETPVSTMPSVPNTNMTENQILKLGTDPGVTPPAQTTLQNTAFGADFRDRDGYSPPANSKDGTSWALKESFIQNATKDGMTDEAARAAVAGNWTAESNAFKVNHWKYNETTKQYELNNPKCWNGMCRYGALSQGDFQGNTPTSFGVMQAHNERADGMVNYINAQREQRAFNALSADEQAKVSAMSSSERSAYLSDKYTPATKSSMGFNGSLNDQINYGLTDDLKAQEKMFPQLKSTMNNPNASVYDKTEAFTKYYERPATDTSQAFDRAGGDARLIAAKNFANFENAPIVKDQSAFDSSKSYNQDYRGNTAITADERNRSSNDPSNPNNTLSPQQQFQQQMQNTIAGLMNPQSVQQMMAQQQAQQQALAQQQAQQNASTGGTGGKTITIKDLGKLQGYDAIQAVSDLCQMDPPKKLTEDKLTLMVKSCQKQLKQEARAEGVDPADAQFTVAQ